MSIINLGRGLDSLIPKKDQKTTILQTRDSVVEVPIQDIQANPYQPRKYFSQEALQGLAESIKEHGLIQPLVVTKRAEGYELLVGERRFRAAQLLGLKTVPAVIRTAQDQEKLEISLIENVQRQNLNPIEKAKAYQRLKNEFNLKISKIASRTGQKQSLVSHYLRLLKLPLEIQEKISLGQVSEGHAKALMGLKSQSKQLEIAQKISAGNFSVRDTEAEAQKLSRRAPRRINSEDLIIKTKEEKLESVLGTRVVIQKKKKGGKIMIEFYSVEELAELVDKICGE